MRRERQQDEMISTVTQPPPADPPDLIPAPSAFASSSEWFNHELELQNYGHDDFYYFPGRGENAFGVMNSFLEGGGGGGGEEEEADGSALATLQQLAT
ncbi:hypothetical protein RQP46_011009 [Phenoliferia psychrophenolica]